MTKTHTMRSRLISLVLVLVMVLGCLPLSALAADPPTSSFTKTWTSGDFRVQAELSDGYTLQTVSGSNPKQNTKLDLTIVATQDIANEYNYIYIALLDSEGKEVRRVMWNNVKVEETSSGSGDYCFTNVGSVFSHVNDVNDPPALQPKVSASADNKYAYIDGIAYTVEGAGTFPVYAQIGYQVKNSTAVTLPAQRIGTFNIASYSDDVMTKNLTFNLDATDAYYAYSTVAMVANENYKLPTVTPIREHYTFKGWKLDDTTTYQPGDTISYTETNKDLMLTAVWKLEQVRVDYPADTDLPNGVTYGTTAPTNGAVDYGTVQSFNLVLDEGYDPATLFVTANDVLLAPVNYVADTDGKVTYTYSFTATADTTVEVSDDLAKLSYVVTMPVGHFNAKLTGNTASETSTTVEYGGSYTFTVDPEDGYKIMGVYVNGALKTAGGTGNNEYTVTNVTGSQVVEVVVEEIPNYTVTYVVNDKQYTTQVVADGNTGVGTLPEAPVVTGYEFDGWYTEQNGDGTQFTADSTVSDNITVYAKLTAETYTITYSANGDNVTDMPSSGTTKTYGQPVQLNTATPSREGYTFLGWSRNENATEATYAAGDYFTEEITTATTLYAVWKANTYTITLPTGTGYTVVAQSENVVGWGEDFKFYVYVDRGYVENTPVVAVNGVQLAGTGRDNASGTKTYEYTISNIQENKVVTITVAKNKTYTVDFQVQGASYLTQEVEYGYCATVPAAPVVEGYTFRGWTTDEANEYPYDFTTPVTEDLTLYAHLEKITYTVKLPTDADGYDVNPNGDQTVDWNGSQKFTVTVEEGYSDANMVVSANGTPLYPIEKTDSTYTYKIFNIKADQEVYVVGVERKTVTITYNDNGGVGGPTQQVANYYVATASDNSEVSAIEPTRDGYVFQGWAKTNTATADGVVYKSGETGKDTLKETTDTTLYAVWARAESEVTLTVEPTTQFEGSEVTLTATVSSGGTGSVLFYRGTDDHTTSGGTLVGTSDVSGDKATATVVVKDYAAGAATDYFYAVFKPTDGAGYTETTSNVVSVTVKSTTIVFGDGDTADDPIVKHWVTGSGLEDVGDGQMVVGETYHLQVPAIYAEDDVTYASPLDAETVTDIVWQYRLPNGEWQTIVTNDRVSIKVTPDVIGMEYRAILTPKGDYKGEALKTDKTKPVLETETTVDLTVAPTEQYEGKDVTLTAAVTTNETIIGEGSVQFYLNGEKIGQPVPVNTESGVATLTWTTSAYSTATDATNKDVYYAEYLGTATYDAGTSSEVEVTVRSTAISWLLEDDAVKTGADQLTIKEGTNVVAQMVAGHTYTLELPAVYALDNMNDEVSEYTVTWQKKDAQQDWVTVAEAGDTYTVTSYKVGDEYRAVVTPADPYTKAQGYNTDGTLADGYVKTLIAGTGVTVMLQPTTTTLEVSDTHDIAVDDGSVLAEFEGQNVTLTATVVDQSTKAAVTTGYVQFYKDNGDGNFDAATDTKIGEPVAVNGNNGTAVIEATMSEYEVNTSDEFYAVYQANETYDTSTSVSKSVLIRSTAIAWTVDGEGNEVKALNVYQGDSTDAGDLISGQSEYYLYANRTYTLQLPAVQEDGQDSVTLKNDVDYTVTWYEIDGSGNATIIPTASGDTCVVTPSEDNMQYFAVVYPKTGSNYTDAYENSAYTTHLTTAQTGNSQRATTVTTLDITNVIERTAGSEPLYEQYEGIEITLTANVKVEDPANAGVGLASPVISQGTVTFYVIMSEDVDAGTATPKQIAKVDVSNGMAQTTYVLPECTLADALEDIEYFYAVYQDSSNNAQGTVTYQSSNSTDDAGEMDITHIVTSDIPADDQVQILSTAISWALNNDVITADGNTIAIYEGDGTTTPLTGNMVATETYTLALPAVYAYNDADDDNLTDKALTVNVDYHVDWQYLDKGMSDWTTLGAASQDTYLITSHVEGRVYRAVVTPIYDQSNVTQYKTAAKYDEDDKVQNLHFTELYTDPTAPTDLKDTVTDLAITGTDHEPAEVWINGSTQEFKEEHYTQFAGQTVTLKATVTEANSDVLVGTGKVYFYRYVDGTNDVKLNDTAVDVNNGIAEYTVTISDYNAKNRVTANVDKFYAVYETNNTYRTSTSTTTKNGDDGITIVYEAPTAVEDMVYIKSTIIDIPVIISTIANESGEKETTKTASLTGLQSGIKHTFTLKDSAGAADATADYSVVALDGRVVDPANYTFEWFTNTGTGEEEITSAATKELLTDITKVGDTFHIHLVAQGDMTGGLHQDGTTIADFAESQNAVIGERQNVNVTVVASDKIDATEETDVYQRNDITLTAEVVPVMDDATMKPTGTVTFYYRTKDTTSAWTEIGEAALAEDSVTGKMVATLVTDELPVDAEAYTKRDLQIYAIYNGDETFQVSATATKVQDEELFNIAGTEGSTTVDDTVTVYSSVVLRSSKENEAQTYTAATPVEDGLMAWVDGSLLENEENVTLNLTSIYTLDGEDDAIVSLLEHNTDYTIAWQEITNYSAWKDNITSADTPWTTLDNSNTHSYSVSVKQGAAYRAVITVKDAAAVQGSWNEVLQAAAEDATTGSKVYYSNILVAQPGQATVTYNVTTSNQTDGYEGIVEGEAVTIHTYVNGATETTPISEIKVTITNAAGEEVFSDVRYNVNGYSSSFKPWTTTAPGYYEMTITATSSNGYAPSTIKDTLIVRDDNYTLSCTEDTFVYDGLVQGIEWTLSGMDIENTMAQNSVVVYYYDADGNLVEPTQAGTYSYKLILPESAYWTEKFIEGTLTVEQRLVNVVDLVPQTKVYDGTTNVNLLEIVLNDAETDDVTGLPNEDTGIINGDSIYATGTGYITAPNAGTETLRVKDLVLNGDDAHNYKLPENTGYSEEIEVLRNQLKGDIADATYAYTGSDITLPAEDVYLINQQGDVTDYVVTYYYHNGEGVEKVDAMNAKGMYTVVVGKDNNYKGGASQTVYVADTAVDAEPVKTAVSTLISITDTAQLYGASDGVKVALTNASATYTLYYNVGGEWVTNEPKDAGRYLVKVTTSTGDTAYGLYTITKANPVLTLTAAGITYDSAPYDGAVSGTYNGGTFPEGTYYTYADGNILGVAYEAPTEAGDYVITAHVPETANYTAHEVKANFTIAKAPLTIKADQLQRFLYSAYPDAVCTYTGLATGGVAPDTSLRDIQIQPELNYTGHTSNDSANDTNHTESLVGWFQVEPVNALAKNYEVSYEVGEFSVTELDPQPELAIHGAPQNGLGTGTIVAYYGDAIQLYAYGNQKGGTINKSSVLKWSVTGPAAFDTEYPGLLHITGVGTVVVTLTRGEGTLAISTSITIEARKQEVKVQLADQDKVYNGNTQTYDGTVSVVDAKYATVTADVDLDNLSRRPIGSQIVTGVVDADEAYYQSEVYGGLFTINDEEAVILPNAVTTIYGTKATMNGYTENAPVGSDAAVLSDGDVASVADAYGNLDAGEYEILVAGREDMNYNVSYKTRPVVTVNELDMDVQLGSYANVDTERDHDVGMTGIFDGTKDFPANGAVVTPLTFEVNGLRMFGEPNQVMGFQTDALIPGDSEADLAKMLAWLVEFQMNDHVYINADANITYPSHDGTPVKITGRDYDYDIESTMDYTNYDVTIIKGTQNIYQRPVTLSLANGVTKPNAYFDITMEDLIKALEKVLVAGKYNGEGGLADLLNHTIKDLDLQFEFTTEDGKTWDGSESYVGTLHVKVTVGNLNYWLANPFEFDVELLPYKYVVEYNSFTATSATVTLYKVDKDGNREAAYLPDGVDLVGQIFTKLSDGATYDDYVASGVYKEYTMVKNSYVTGRYTVTYPRLTGNYRFYATVKDVGYNIISQ